MNLFSPTSKKSSTRTTNSHSRYGPSSRTTTTTQWSLIPPSTWITWDRPRPTPALQTKSPNSRLKSPTLIGLCQTTDQSLKSKMSSTSASTRPSPSPWRSCEAGWSIGWSAAWAATICSSVSTNISRWSSGSRRTQGRLRKLYDKTAGLPEAAFNFVF